MTCGAQNRVYHISACLALSAWPKRAHGERGPYKGLLRAPLKGPYKGLIRDLYRALSGALYVVWALYRALYRALYGALYKPYIGPFIGPYLGPYLGHLCKFHFSIGLRFNEESEILTLFCLLSKISIPVPQIGSQIVRVKSISLKLVLKKNHVTRMILPISRCFTVQLGFVKFLKKVVAHTILVTFSKFSQIPPVL